MRTQCVSAKEAGIDRKWAQARPLATGRAELLTSAPCRRRASWNIRMQKITIIAASLLMTGAAHGQSAAPAPIRSPASVANPSHYTMPRAAAGSTPESRSAAALALSHEPTYDDGTA